MRLRKIVVILLFIMLFVPFLASGANISIPEFEMVTHGRIEDGSFILSTYGDIDMLIEGGYKFGGKLSFSLAESSLDLTGGSLDGITTVDGIKSYLGSVISLKSVQVLVRDMFGLPVNLTYFTGTLGPVVSGTDFSRIFGTKPIATDFLGYMYYPDDTDYKGLHVPAGTGLQFETNELTDWFYGSAALYQDGYIGPGIFSADLRGLFNFKRFKMETYIGASFPASAAGLYRMGLLLYYSTEKGGEFLTQIGIPRWDPGVDPSFNINHFFFLFEPRVNLGLLTISLTLFWHPEYFLLTPTGEEGTMDINTKFILGNLCEQTMSGGIENTIRINPYSDNQLEISVAPFYSLATNGVIFDLKFKSRILPFEAEGLIQGYIGIRTEF
ncbi:MAG: hypothetical protein ACLFST_05365 [Spirochaetia bacterium]